MIKLNEKAKDPIMNEINVLICQKKILLSF